MLLVVNICSLLRWDGFAFGMRGWLWPVDSDGNPAQSNVLWSCLACWLPHTGEQNKTDGHVARPRRLVATSCSATASTVAAASRKPRPHELTSTKVHEKLFLPVYFNENGPAQHFFFEGNKSLELFSSQPWRVAASSRSWLFTRRDLFATLKRPHHFYADRHMKGDKTGESYMA